MPSAAILGSDQCSSNSKAPQLKSPNRRSAEFWHAHCCAQRAMEDKEEAEYMRGKNVAGHQPSSSEAFIDATNEEDLRTWARRLGCSEEELRDAVHEVGPLV